MIDYFEEIFTTLKQNKLRVIMTGFSVAWGIFMLLLLLGSGKGLQQGIENNFRGISTNAIWISSGETSEAYEGMGIGRRIQFTNEDYEYLKKELDGVGNISGRMYMRGSAPLSYKNEFGIFTLTFIMPAYMGIEKLDLKKGRFINEIDIKERRKVITLSTPIAEILFKDEEPLGKYVKAGRVIFQVVGIFEDYGNPESRKAFLPISTGQGVFSGDNKIANIALTTTSSLVEENKQIEAKIRTMLARKHRFSESDDNALFIFNTLESFSQIQGVFAGIRMFIWIIGVMTIIAGIAGVSNIMIILVKERTKEIGIRKAIGASPWSVIRLVLSESLFITAIAGFFGLLFGMGVLNLINMILVNIAQSNPDVNRFFYNPTADFGVAVSAVVLLVVAGLIAGYIPARKAASIKPVDALYDE